MAAPNLSSPTTITGKTTYLALSSTSETDLLVNSAGSGKALRITALFLCNVDGINNADATLKIYSAASGGTGYSIISSIAIPALATVTPLGRDISLWLEEDRRLSVASSAANDITVVCSYEEVA